MSNEKKCAYCRAAPATETVEVTVSGGQSAYGSPVGPARADVCAQCAVSMQAAAALLKRD